MNAAAVLQDKQLALNRASNLLGYQNYLAQCRAWKATQPSVPASFEREVLTHAQQALVDARDLATRSLRVTRQMKQSGRLDDLVASCAAATRASGPVQVQDLWADITESEQTRQLLRDQGLGDDMFTVLDGQMRRIQGRLTAQGGNLVATIGLVGKATRAVTLSPSATGSPRSLDDLLHRGQFERIVEKFEQGGVLPLALVPGNVSQVALDDVFATGAVLATQLVAQHVRKLGDTGLAVYGGHDPDVATVLIVCACLAVLAGVVIHGFSCPLPPAVQGGPGKKGASPTFCTIAKVLIILAALALLVGAFFLDPTMGFAVAGGEMLVWMTFDLLGKSPQGF
jgi:hypothetical protein